MQGHLNAERTQLSVVQHFSFAMHCVESLGVDGLRVFLGVVLILCSADQNVAVARGCYWDGLTLPLRDPSDTYWGRWFNILLSVFVGQWC